MENLYRYFVRNIRIILNTYVREGVRQPIIRHISLEEYILCIKLDLVVNIHSAKDTSYRIILYDLITNSSVYNTYLGYQSKGVGRSHDTYY